MARDLLAMNSTIKITQKSVFAAISKLEKKISNKPNKSPSKRKNYISQIYIFHKIIYNMKI